MTVSNRHCSFSWLLQSRLPEGTRVVIVLPFHLGLFVPVREAFLATSLKESLNACLEIKAEEKVEDKAEDKSEDVKKDV